MTVITRFNLRVYGIVINHARELLLCTEEKDGLIFTKFPGGGLEFGEGLVDGLQREFREELNTEVKNIHHFYTTEKFQQSAFLSSDQVISVYYTLDLQNEMIHVEEIQDKTNSIHFFWQPVSRLNTGDVTFPIDKLVVEKILKSV